MAFSPMSGINAAVKISSTAYAFSKWKASMKAMLPKVNSFLSPYQALVGGMKSATVTLSGPYDQGNMAFTAGNAYTFLLGWNDSVVLSIPVLLGEITGSQDAEDAGRVEITGESNGAFTAAIA